MNLQRKENNLLSSNFFLFFFSIFKIILNFFIFFPVAHIKADFKNRCYIIYKYINKNYYYFLNYINYLSYYIYRNVKHRLKKNTEKNLYLMKKSCKLFS
jgi:hypothetical protein